MGDHCAKPGCLIPRPHEHTGEFGESYVEDWWCPTEDRWSMCPGPCPDGTLHGPSRRVACPSERIILTDRPSHPLRRVET